MFSMIGVNFSFSSRLWLQNICCSSIEYRSSLRRGVCVRSPVMFGNSAGFRPLGVRCYARYCIFCCLCAPIFFVALCFGVSSWICFFLHATNQLNEKFVISVTSTMPLVN